MSFPGSWDSTVRSGPPTGTPISFFMCGALWISIMMESPGKSAPTARGTAFSLIPVTLVSSPAVRGTLLYWQDELSESTDVLGPCRSLFPVVTGSTASGILRRGRCSGAEFPPSRGVTLYLSSIPRAVGVSGRPWRRGLGGRVETLLHLPPAGVETPCWGWGRGGL